MIQKHTHKLKRHKYSTGVAVYFCTLPDCNYKIETALALGKRSVCNLCDREFFLTEYHIKLAKPHCDACSKRKVRGTNGKNYYVRTTKTESSNLLGTLAQTSLSELKNRLGSVVTYSTNATTKDDADL